MDPQYSAQEILLCDLCQTPALQSHCELCHVNLCIVCVGKHLSDSFKRHNVVSYKHKTSAPINPKCPNHTQKHCELYCEKCDIPVCSSCISSGKHKGHDLTDALLKLSSLSALSITKDKYGYIMKTPEAAKYPPVKSLLDEPELITIIGTGYDRLYSLTCHSDKEIWTCGNKKIMKLFNIQGKLQKSIKTKSGNKPRDVAVTKSGDLVYTDSGTRTVNIVKNKQIQEVIRLQEWLPYNVCSTSNGDLLVTMDSDNKHSKVVRYFGSTEKQTIQFDSKGKPLFSSGYYSKYISENRNLDICLADCEAKAVVVVNQAGKLRFRYIGHPYSTKESFNPVGIATDSQSQILTADYNNNCIHILDQDGQFLSFIDNCDLHRPWGLSVDTWDNLLVAERNSVKAKKIKYMKIWN
ncbi:tripartite motif-containing protein 3-like [Saccostrea cucullata]|uniref:tripartite motif-containing protein 3-like n=1 Tax=Saccostrea cuccullata TaxID=36930 RepID=UPI002ED69B44